MKIKKLSWLFASVLLAVCLAACQPQQQGSSDLPSETSALSSVGELPVSSSSSPEETSSVSSGAAWSDPEHVDDGFVYRINKVPFSWEQGEKSYEVEYLQILGDAQGDYSKVNMLLKERAMQAANLFGYQPLYDQEKRENVPITVKTQSEIAYRDNQMISVVLRTEYTVGDGEPVSILETVNCYLDETNDLGAEQTELTMENMLNVNDDFANLVHTAVQNQTSVNVQAYLTPERVRAALGANPIYFLEHHLVVSLSVPQNLGGHVEVSIPYSQLAPFMKLSEIWRHFVY